MKLFLKCLFVYLPISPKRFFLPPKKRQRQQFLIIKKPERESVWDYFFFFKNGFIITKTVQFTAVTSPISQNRFKKYVTQTVTASSVFFVLEDRRYGKFAEK